MSWMSGLDIEVRQAEHDGRKFFATRVHDGWAVFDVEAARQNTETGIEFVRGPRGAIVTGTQLACEQAAQRLNEGT